MHDEHLSIAVKDAGETFEPPWVDVRAVASRGRRRRWLTRTGAAATALALTTGVVAASRVDLGARRKAPANAAAPGVTLQHWEPIPAAPIASRWSAAAAWTGSELVVLGGNDERQAFRDGASFDPASSTWEKLPEAPGPEIQGSVAVWTGRELIFWGGEDGGGGHEQPYRGRAYDAATRRWRTLPPAPSWSLGNHTAVWTGTEMLVWGGVPAVSGPGPVAAAYDPATDEWKKIPSGPLGSRHGHAAVWTGEEMVVWGGYSQDGSPVEGPDAAAYDPETRSWRALPDSPLDPVSAPVSFWTGREVVIAGGLGAGRSRAGAAYDPATDRWRSIAPVPLVRERDDQLPVMLDDLSTPAVWTGSEAVFVTFDGVLAYHPDADRWTWEPAPEKAWRRAAAIVWTGDRLMVWSGQAGFDPGLTPDGWIARR
jgi:hypothetical protein